MKRWLRLAPIVAVLAGACGSPAGPRLDRVPTGGWGGDHVALTVETAGATVEFDCAHGRMDGPLLLDRGGRFHAGGVFVQDHGGPVRVGEPEDAHPAVYDGVTDGDFLTFQIAVADLGETLGPFTVVRGAPPRVVRCL